jgi:hypothetical protein
VLQEQLLVGLGAAAVGLRVAPAVEQVAALAVAAAGAAGGLSGGGAVVDDPHSHWARGLRMTQSFTGSYDTEFMWLKSSGGGGGGARGVGSEGGIGVGG